jgi:hypothetical protein
VHKLKVARKYQNVALHLHVDSTDPSRVTFCTLPAASLANLATPSHAAAARKVLDGVRGSTPLEVAGVSGVLLLSPRMFDCTEVTLSASVTTLQPSATESEAFHQGAASGVPADDGSTYLFRGFTRRVMPPGSTVSSQVDITPELTELILCHLVSAVPHLYTRYARCNEIDEANLNYFETVTVPSAPPISQAETGLVDRSLLFDAPDSPWKRMPNTIHESVSYFQKSIKNGESAWGKGVASVDASAARVLSTQWSLGSYERIYKHINNYGADCLRKHVQIPNTRSMFFVFLLPFAGTIKDRIFAFWFTWREEENGDIVVAFTDMDDCGEFPDVSEALNREIASHARAAKAVRGSLRGLWRFRPLAPNVCEVTYAGQAKMNGRIPLVLLNFRLRSSLNDVAELQAKYERKGVTVDAEIRGAFRSPGLVSALTVEQQEIYERCCALQDTGGDGWVGVPSPSPFVKMSKKHYLPLPGERSVALGVCVSTIDCSVEQAVAWWEAFCSRERMRTSDEEGNPARIIVKEYSSHDKVCASIKKFPFPMYSREFVARQICALDNEASNGDLVFAVESVGLSVDYGLKMKTVRATTRAFTRFTPVGTTQCKVVIYQYADVGGNIPVAVVNTLIPYTLSLVDDLRAVFQRDDEVDAVQRAEYAGIIAGVPQEYTSEEVALCHQIKNSIGNIPIEQFKELASPDHHISIHLTAESSMSGVARGVTVVDATVEECSVWEMAKTSRDNWKDHAADSGLERHLIKSNEHHNAYHVVYDLGIPGFRPREWVTSQIWKWESPSTLEVFSDSISHVDFPLRDEYVRATSTVLYKYDKLAEVGGTPQTRVTLIQRVDLRGNIPKRAVGEGAVVNQMMYLNKMRLRFDESLKIDASSRAMIVKTVKNHSAEYSDEENEIIEEELKNFAIFEDQKAKDIKMEVPTTVARIAFSKGSSQAWGFATTIMRTTPEEIVALSWDTMSRGKHRDDDLEKSVDENVNDHNQLVYNRKATPKIYADRDFLGRMIWKKASESGFVLVARPEESVRRPALGGVVRGKFPNTMRMTRLNNKETKVDFLIHPDLGGAVPAFMMSFYTAKNLKKVTEVQQYFQALRGMEEYDEGDGKAVGEIMVVKTKKEKHPDKGETKVDARMRLLFEKYKGLKEIGAEYEFFEAMMAMVLENKLRPAKDVSTRLCNVSNKQGRRIGAGLAMSLASNLTAEAAVDEWIGRYPALKELDREEVWFRSMMDTVALRLLGDVSWGLKMRVFMGAGLSVLDMVSDINVIWLYSNSLEEEKYVILLVGMIATCMGLQLITTFVQYHKKSMVRQLGELLIVFTGLKPG